jgi:hypothetical protein
MADAFFLPHGDGFLPTELTRGPWDPDAQHGGPPAALLGRAAELAGRPGLQVARMTFEILRPVPIAPLEVATRVVRGGRSVELVEASLSAAGVEVMRGTALRLRQAEVPLPDGLGPDQPLPGPAHGRALPFFPTGQDVGYHTAMEWSFLDGAFLEPGPATVWLRMRHPLLPGEPPSPLCRVLIAADSANGVGASLDYRNYLFINPDLTVYLHRAPVGEWVCLAARATAEPNGVGLVECVLHDERGPVARGLQSLLVSRR